MKLKKPKTGLPSAVNPEQLPFKPLDTNVAPNSNVDILKMEKYFGDVAALRTHAPIPIRSAIITPGGHIRRKEFNKENEVDLRQNENNCERNLASDTLSMSGLLSASKIQGNSTKTNADSEYISLASPAIHSTEESGSVDENINLEITPTNSPIQNRKRNRTPNSGTPSSTLNALDVYYNSKHRLSPAPRTQSNSSTPERLVGTPETPKSNGKLEVLFNRRHRLTPSPVGNKNRSTETKSSTPATPIQSLHLSNGFHATNSTNFLGPSSSNMRNFDTHARSPKLLAQSNSQFSSVTDLREFAIKSSQSVISWPSQKLRTSSVKQFTIKNIGGKKLTMKIEVVGPGFQVNDDKEKDFTTFLCSILNIL